MKKATTKARRRTTVGKCCRLRSLRGRQPWEFGIVQSSVHSGAFSVLTVGSLASHSPSFVRRHLQSREATAFSKILSVPDMEHSSLQTCGLA